MTRLRASQAVFLVACAHVHARDSHAPRTHGVRLAPSSRRSGCADEMGTRVCEAGLKQDPMYCTKVGFLRKCRLSCKSCPSAQRDRQTDGAREDGIERTQPRMADYATPCGYKTFECNSTVAELGTTARAQASALHSQRSAGAKDPSLLSGGDPANAAVLISVKPTMSSITHSLTEALAMLDTHMNCRVRAPVFVFYDHLGTIPASGTAEQQMQALETVAKNALCSKVTLVNVDKYWEVPANADAIAIEKHMKDGSCPRGICDRLGYKSMCRFWSGLVFLLPELRPFDYYMRIDADSKIKSRMENPFQIMADRGLSYMYRTIVTDKLEPGLLEHTDEFFCNKRPSSIMDTNSIYYNNFEVGRLDFFRSEPYQNYFQYLDQFAGFHFLRWGDALVRTFAVDTLLPRGAVSSFTSFIYNHGMDIGIDALFNGTTLSNGIYAHPACSAGAWVHRDLANCPRGTVVHESAQDDAGTQPALSRASLTNGLPGLTEKPRKSLALAKELLQACGQDFSEAVATLLRVYRDK